MVKSAIRTIVSLVTASAVISQGAWAYAATHVLEPGQSIQAAINASAYGDVIILMDGIYHEAINITRSITLKALHHGEATVTNKFPGPVTWTESSPGSKVWSAAGINWPVHGLRVEGFQAYDYRSKQNFDARTVGPFWAKGWQAGSTSYTNPLLYFAWEPTTNTLWLKLNDNRNPNNISVDFNSSSVDGKTLIQKDLGAYWNQQQIVEISKNPPVYPATMWYGGTEQKPDSPKYIEFPKICGIANIGPQ